MIDIPFPSMLNELLDYSKDKSFEIKVRRIHRLCIKSGRIVLADKIEMKYGRYFPKSDLVMAFRMALFANGK